MRSLARGKTTRILGAAAVFVLLPLTARADDDTYDDADPAALSDFQSTLAPYGSWVDDPTYGTTWVPAPSAVGPDFVPYQTAGHWAYGDDYVWVSDYNWGWVPFHYGRWVQMDAGWGWVPGREYAPAWVTWNTPEPGYDYVGWAPAPPLYVWRGGVAVTCAVPIAPAFIYVGTGDVFAPNIGVRVLPRERAAVIGVHMHAFSGEPGAGRGGPSPARLHVEPSRVVRATGNEPGVARARDYAAPSTAARYGARPATHNANTSGAHFAAASPNAHLQPTTSQARSTNPVNRANTSAGSQPRSENPVNRTGSQPRSENPVNRAPAASQPREERYTPQNETKQRAQIEQQQRPQQNHPAPTPAHTTTPPRGNSPPRRR